VRETEALLREDEALLREAGALVRDVSTLQCVAVCCSVLQYVAVRCVAVCCTLYEARALISRTLDQHTIYIHEYRWNEKLGLSLLTDISSSRTSMLLVRWGREGGVYSGGCGISREEERRKGWAGRRLGCFVCRYVVCE